MNFLEAFGMFLRGDWHSPAARVISSGPITNAKPDLIRAAQKAKNLPKLPR